MKKTITYILLLFSLTVFSQKQITLEECYQLINTNFPLAKQSAILETQNALDLETIKTGKLPERFAEIVLMKNCLCS